jgi:hypothetical protein
LDRFVKSYGDQISAEKDALQMAGPMTDLQDPISLNEWDHTQDPVFPPPQRDSRRDQIISERELVVEQAEEES